MTSLKEFLVEFHLVWNLEEVTTPTAPQPKKKTKKKRKKLALTFLLLKLRKLV